MTAAATEAAPVAADTPAPATAGEKGAPFGQAALKVQVAQLSELVQTLATALGRLTEGVSRQGQELSEVRSQLGRLALAMGRQDLLTPPATVEQLREGYRAGRSLLVLKDCTVTGGFRFIAGTKVEARQYDLERMANLVEQGHLAVAVVE